MTKAIVQRTEKEKEYIADLLKERIYATLALLAVLISIDAKHLTPLHSAYIICGTIISLWAASIVASQMSRRLVFQTQLHPPREIRHQIRRHAPMLASLIFPVLMITLSSLGLFTLNTAINISIVSSLLLLVGWSLGSALSLRAGSVQTILFIILELTIGLAIVGLKIIVGH